MNYTLEKCIAGTRLRSAYTVFNGGTPLACIGYSGPKNWVAMHLMMRNEKTFDASPAHRNGMYGPLIEDKSKYYNKGVRSEFETKEDAAEFVVLNPELFHSFDFVKSLLLDYTAKVKKERQDRAEREQRRLATSDRIATGLKSLWDRADLSDDERFALKLSHEQHDIYISGLARK